MNCARSRWTRRISTAILTVVVPALAVVVPTLAVAQPAAAAYPVTPAHLATDPPAAERTLPHLSFVCPTAIGDHKFAGLLPDGPVQEQCFYDDGHGSNFGVRANWETTPADPSDTRAVCAEPARTSWHEEGSNANTYTRSSTTRRASAGVVLNLYWPTKEKLARQKSLLAQSQALGEELLAAAEKLAQPCWPATPTTSASPSDPAQPSPSPTEPPEPSPTDQEPLCEAVEGRLTDNGGHPVKGIVIRLSVPGEQGPVEVEAQTDAQGRFRFGEIPDTEQARARDAARLVVLVRDGSDRWRLYAGSHEATLVTKPFSLHESGGCRHDLTTTSLDGYTSASPETAANWADLWTVVTETRRALAYATTELGVELRDLPVVIYAWCPPSLNAKTCTPNGYGAFAHDRTPTEADHEVGLGSSGQVPHIALAPRLTDALSEAPEDDTVYHQTSGISCRPTSPVASPGWWSRAGPTTPATGTRRATTRGSRASRHGSPSRCGRRTAAARRTTSGTRANRRASRTTSRPGTPTARMRNGPSRACSPTSPTPARRRPAIRGGRSRSRSPATQGPG